MTQEFRSSHFQEAFMLSFLADSIEYVDCSREQDSAAIVDLFAAYCAEGA